MIKTVVDIDDVCRGLSAQDGVYIFPSDAQMTADQEQQLYGLLDQFTSEWSAHGVFLDARARVVCRRFVLVFTHHDNQPSGCSLDVLHRQIKQFGQECSLNLFAFRTFTYLYGGRLVATDEAQFVADIQAGRLPVDTCFFSHHLRTVGQLRTSWFVPAHQSWLADRYTFPLPTC